VFDLRSVKFLVNKVALEQSILRVPRFIPVGIIQSVLHIDISLSVTFLHLCHQNWLIFVVTTAFVICEVRTEFLRVNEMNLNLKNLTVKICAILGYYAS